jgi:hypothetical protein
VPVAKITGQGLAAIGFSVALLWGCILGEAAMARQAYAERMRVLQDVEFLQRHRSEPVSFPMPHHPAHVRILAGSHAGNRTLPKSVYNDVSKGC